MFLQRVQHLLGSSVCAVFLMTASVPVFAGMIGTEQIIQQQQLQTEKLKIQAALAREDVKQLLLQHGVTPQQAHVRISQLTDREIRQLAQQFDELPAPGTAGVLLLISGPAMLLLEFMGMTDLTTAF